MLVLFLYLVTIGLSLLVVAVALRTIRRHDQPSETPGHPDGRTVARRTLKLRGIHQRVRVTGGDVDCYVTSRREVQLADGRLERASTSAAAVAAHEAVHAAQDTSGWRVFRLSVWLSVVSVVAGPVAIVCLVVALVFDLTWLSTVGAVVLIPVVLSSLVTTIIEVDASRRALEALRAAAPAGVIDLRGARRVLVACGATYVTETILDLGYFSRRAKNLADDLSEARGGGRADGDELTGSGRGRAGRDGDGDSGSSSGCSGGGCGGG